MEWCSKTPTVVAARLRDRKQLQRVRDSQIGCWCIKEPARAELEAAQSRPAQASMGQRFAVMAARSSMQGSTKAGKRSSMRAFSESHDVHVVRQRSSMRAWPG